MNAQTMISVEKKRARSISCDASMIRSISGRDRSAFCAVMCRKMFSTMITELSTMIPKSTAPIDSRLADLPCTYSTVTENSRASGIMMATIAALARSPRKMKRIAITRPMPTSRLCTTFSVVTFTSSVRWLKSLICIPLGRSFRFWISSIFSSTLSERRQRLFVLPHQHDALDDVVFGLPSDRGQRPPGAADAVPRPWRSA